MPVASGSMRITRLLPQLTPTTTHSRSADGHTWMGPGLLAPTGLMAASPAPARPQTLHRPTTRMQQRAEPTEALSMPLTASMTMRQGVRMAATHGVLPASFWRPTVWHMPENIFWHSIASSCLLLRSSPVGSREAALAACAGAWLTNAGRLCKLKHAGCSGESSWSNGATMNFAAPTSTARATGPRREGTSCARTLCAVIGRPRSMRAQGFQSRADLHPYGPFRRKHRSRDPGIMSSITCSYRNAEQQAHCSVAQRGRSPTRPSCRAGGPASNLPEGQSMASLPDCSQLSPSPLILSPSTRHVVNREPFQPNSRSGPKSGVYLFLLIHLWHFREIDGVRVPPAATAGGGPIDSLEPVGKHRGQAHPWTPTAYSVAGMKRAYRRAKIRAATSSSGGTWYRGQWHSSQTLGTLATPESLPWRTRKRTRGLTAPKASRLSVLSWNTGGLNSSMYQEIMAWCDQQGSLILSFFKKHIGVQPVTLYQDAGS